MKKINIVGGGLAGSELALQFADSGWQVFLYEMRPAKMTPAHKTDKFAEIVCSNSFKSMLPSSPSGLLKAEMEILGCKLLEIAKKFSVPAGSALAVDRDKFSEYVSNLLENHNNIHIIREEFTNPETDELTVLATGPLTSDNLIQKLQELIGEEQLYFFDAIAPIVSADSIDYSVVYRKSRYNKGDADYLNCPFTKEQYEKFVSELNKAEKHEAKEFENRFFKEIKFKFYENCTPIEELARRGIDTLRFGVMKPVGLQMEDGKRPYAVIQLRAENNLKTAYNLVGCQTMLKYSEQKRIFRLVPGLEHAEFLRYGSIHRNSYLNSPEILNEDLSLKVKKNIFIAGQLSGVEGYVESILSALLIYLVIDKGLKQLPKETMSGALWSYLITQRENFQPMNANFGLLPPLKERIKDKKKRKEAYYNRAVETMKKYCNGLKEQ